MKIRYRIGFLLAFGILFFCPMKVLGYDSVRAQYEQYQERFSEIHTISDIEKQGYIVVEKHVFDIPLVTHFPEPDESGERIPTEVFRPEEPYRIVGEDPVRMQEVPTVRFFCATEKENHRAAVFLADGDGNICYKTNELECNYAVLGELDQPIYDLISVAFQDLNGDGRMDIILIAGCSGDGEDGESENYKIGEVLFQSENAGEVSFYRDYRINDKINRFAMNRSAKSIWSFVRDGRSSEFLYTAVTEEELLQEGFAPINTQIYRRNYEKLGNLKVFPGIFSQGDNDILMIYMIDEQGKIVWRFQPMEEYENLYALRGMSAADLDGDGMKDLLVVARYSRETDDGTQEIVGKFSIYYQRTGGFHEDTEFAAEHPYRADQTVNELVEEIRRYWGVAPKAGKEQAVQRTFELKKGK